MLKWPVALFWDENHKSVEAPPAAVKLVWVPKVAALHPVLFLPRVSAAAAAAGVVLSQLSPVLHFLSSRKLWESLEDGQKTPGTDVHPGMHWVSGTTCPRWLFKHANFRTF